MDDRFGFPSLSSSSSTSLFLSILFIFDELTLVHLIDMYFNQRMFMEYKFYKQLLFRTDNANSLSGFPQLKPQYFRGYLGIYRGVNGPKWLSIVPADAKRSYFFFGFSSCSVVTIPNLNDLVSFLSFFFFFLRLIRVISMLMFVPYLSSILFFFSSLIFNTFVWFISFVIFLLFPYISLLHFQIRHRCTRDLCSFFLLSLSRLLGHSLFSYSSFCVCVYELTEFIDKTKLK